MPLHVQGDEALTGWQGSGPKKNNIKMKGQGGGEAQGVGGPKSVFLKLPSYTLAGFDLTTLNSADGVDATRPRRQSSM
jgi:hypothetical protein